MASLNAGNSGNADEEMEIIVLDDDDGYQGPRCLNYQCRKKTDLQDAPAFCLTYYHIKGKVNGQQICERCYNAAVEHFIKLEKSLKEGRSLFSVNFPNFCEVVEVDSDEGGDCESDMLDQETLKTIQENIVAVLQGCDMKYKVDECINNTLGEMEMMVDKHDTSLQEIGDGVKDIRKQLDSIIHGIYTVPRAENIELPELIIHSSEPYTEAIEVTPDVEAMNVESLKPPPDLPNSITPLEKPNLVVGQEYYTRRTDSISWIKVRLEQIIPAGSKINDCMVRNCMYQVVRPKAGNYQRVFVEKRNLAYSTVLPWLLNIGTRVIALISEGLANVYYPGIVGEHPCAYNRYRYLIFFDDGYVLYIHYKEVFMMCDYSKDVWEDIYPESRAFIKKYVTEYPNRSMVRFAKHQKVRTEYKGKWYETSVQYIDCSLVQMYFIGLGRTEWIYRGSRRMEIIYQEELAAHNRSQPKHRYPRARNRPSCIGAPYVEYSSVQDDDVVFISQEPVIKEGVRAVAKKSTRSTPIIQPKVSIPKRPPFQQERPAPGKIVYYTPRKPMSFYTYTPHNCGVKCVKNVPPLSRLKGYGPLAKPILSGFFRMLYKTKHRKPCVTYKTPCGRTTRNMEELHRYLKITQSELTVDLFDFNPTVRCLAEFILEAKGATINKDLSKGLENVPLPVVNYVNNKECDVFTYSTKRIPLEGVNLNLDENFLICCNCTDDCADKSKCDCWQLTMEGAKKLRKSPDEMGYDYRRLLEPNITGIFECNTRCKCKNTCLNRVAQNPLQHKLQVFMTSNGRGWGIRCLNDIPHGSFVCIYAGTLLTDKMANDGRHGDEYYAELDFIETVEGTKANYEDEAYQSDVEIEKSTKKIEEKNKPISAPTAFTESETTQIVAVPNKTNTDLYFPAPEDGSIRSRLRKRDVEINYKKLGEESLNLTDEEGEDESSKREPIRFNPDGDMDEPVSKYPSVRTFFGIDEDVYIMDAKSTGNLGRFLNHSCSPNMFVQNVFVDAHDIRFPWVAFFAAQNIRAGTELTWNYNYEVGSVPDKVMYCNCGSVECKGRLL